MLDAIQKRKSVRLYESKVVEKEKLQAVLEAFRAAPSGRNTQPWKVLVVENEERKALITTACHNQVWMNTAPVFLVVAVDPSGRMETADKIIDENSPEMALKQSIRDTSLAIDHAMLEAVNQGLSTCYIGLYDQESIKNATGISPDFFVLGVLTLGYESKDHVYRERPRKPLEAFVFYETWPSL